MVCFLLKAVDPVAISAAARCISLSFSTDPFIGWLRHGAAPWGPLNADTRRWQERRVKRALTEGVVMACHDVPQALKGEERIECTKSVLANESRRRLYVEIFRAQRCCCCDALSYSTFMDLETQQASAATLLVGRRLARSSIRCWSRPKSE